MSILFATHLESLTDPEMESRWVWILSKLTACPLMMASHSDSGKDTCLGKLIMEVTMAHRSLAHSSKLLSGFFKKRAKWFIGLILNEQFCLVEFDLFDIG
jgi:hypothetical protein